MKRRGASLFELIAAMFMMLLISGALFTIFRTTYFSHDAVVGQSDADTASRTPIDILADHLRNAQAAKAAGYAAIVSGGATEVTYYASDNTSDTVRYWLDGTDLKRTTGGTTTVVMSDVSALNFTYYKASSTPVSYYNSSVSQTDNPTSPSATELPNLAMIRITATVNIDGYSRELLGWVRLRNSPRKNRL